MVFCFSIFYNLNFDFSQSVSLIEPVVSHDEPGDADYSINDRDIFFEQTWSFLQD